MIKFILGVLVGVVVGWIWRSIQHGYDQECAEVHEVRVPYYE